MACDDPSVRAGPTLDAGAELPPIAAYSFRDLLKAPGQKHNRVPLRGSQVGYRGTNLAGAWFQTLVLSALRDVALRFPAIESAASDYSFALWPRKYVLG